jgi:diguanylate cyclase (GGDEF)-like protein
MSQHARVILVGRTGLEQSLRRDAGVRVVRVGNTLEAVGELHQDAGEDGPPPVVVLSPEAIARAGEIDAGATREVAAALRAVDPAVRVLSVGAPAPGCDGVVSAGADASAVLSITSAPGGPATDGRAADGRAAPATTDHTRGASETHIACPADDAGALQRVLMLQGEAVAALLRGDDPTNALLACVREACADPGVRFVPAPGAGGAGADQHAAVAVAPARGVPVAWDGALLGWLVSERAGHGAGGMSQAQAPAPLLAPWLAPWLAGFLRLRDQSAALRRAAFVDPLTGAWNRRYFEQFLGAAIGRARAARRSVTLMVFDIDNFKRFNDQHGHGAGDEVLRETIALLRSVVRPTDRVCRIGGDEFAVIFDEPEGPRAPDSKHPTDVHQIADRFQKQIRERRFPKLGLEAPGCLAISGGLATFPWDGLTAEALLASADERAMRCKREGKNAIVFGPGAERVGG